MDPESPNEKIETPSSGSTSSKPTPASDSSVPQVDYAAIAKKEHKKNSFDKEFRSLMIQSRETVDSKYGIAASIGGPPEEIYTLERYSSVYENTKPEDHYRYFESLYNSKRRDILRTLEDDKWIRNGNIRIQFGDGIKATPEIEEKRKNIRIMLSSIFRIACDIKERTTKSLDGVDESLAQGVGGKDLIRPNIILLHLMRIFYHINETEDKKIIGDVVTKLENELGVTKKTVGAEPVGPISSAGLGGIFAAATSMMQKLGINPPAGAKMPTDSDLTEAVNSVFSNEDTQKTITQMISSLNGATDFNSIVQKMMQTASDPKTMETIRTSVEQSAQSAIESSKKTAVPENPNIQ